MAFGCVGSTIRLRSGKYLDLKAPRPEDFTFADIACGLSRICRFGGQVDVFYSVAEHSILCALQAHTDGWNDDVVRAVLFHDAAEAFVGDMVKPLKEQIAGFSEVEDGVSAAIAEKFGIDFAINADVIKEIDHAMLIAERRALFSADDVLWTGESEVRVLSPFIAGMSHREAESSLFICAGKFGIEVGI